MVGKEYARNFNKFSEVFSSKHLSSMAQVGRLQNLKRGVPNPYYENQKEVGKVKIPDDIFSLRSVPDIEVQIWYYGDSASRGTGRNNAFELRISGYDEVSPIVISYGMVSGIQKIAVYGRDMAKHECAVPDGFTLAKFVDILNKGTLKDFVLKHCSNLSQSQKQCITEHGLC